MDVPAGVIQEEGHTGFLHFNSFCGACLNFFREKDSAVPFSHPPCEVEFCVVVVDSHIQRIVLATEETTVTQQVSHRPIKRQSRLWSQRGTKVNGSHHGDNPLLRPTGIQIATKSYAALQAMAPTNIKTVHQTSLLHSRATSIDSECCRLPTTSVLSKNRKNYAPTSFDQQVQVSQGHTFCTEIRKIEIPRSMVVEALNW